VHHLEQQLVSLTVRLPKELADAFDRACHAKDRTKSQIMRDLIKSFLAGDKQPKLPL